jgi:hypothetical protein
MRLSNPVELKRITQALDRGGCPVCSFLKNLQSAILKTATPKEIHTVCNFHAWALAAAVDAARVAKVFLHLLEPSSTPQGRCSVCEQIEEQERTRVAELASQVQRSLVRDWIERHGTFCRPHAIQLAAALPATTKGSLATLEKKTIDQLKRSLAELAEHDSQGKAAGSGVLGHAAEFLVSQRGVRLKEGGKC